MKLIKMLRADNKWYYHSPFYYSVIVSAVIDVIVMTKIYIKEEVKNGR